MSSEEANQAVPEKIEELGVPTTPAAEKPALEPPVAQVNPPATMGNRQENYSPGNAAHDSQNRAPSSAAEGSTTGGAQDEADSDKDDQAHSTDSHDNEKNEAKKKKKSASRARRERRERQAAAMLAGYGSWDAAAAAHGWGYDGTGYGMEYGMPGMGMGMMGYMDPMMGMDMGTGVGGYMGNMRTFNELQYGASTATAQPPSTATAAAKPKASDGKPSSGGLSINAKPWSPPAESELMPSPAPATTKDTNVDINDPAFTLIEGVNGSQVPAPASMVPHGINNNAFTHSVPIIPKANPSAELEMFMYKCARCPLRTLYGRLSSRRADVTITNIAPDVPPLCLAHLLEQVAKVRITALVASHPSSSTQYDLWLDKTSMSETLIRSVTGALWTSPMPHGFAVVAKTEEAKIYLSEYLTKLKNDPVAEKTSYPLLCVEAREH